MKKKKKKTSNVIASTQNTLKTTYLCPSNHQEHPSNCRYNISQSVYLNFEILSQTACHAEVSKSLCAVCKHLKGHLETLLCTCCPLHTTQPKISTSTKGVKSPDNVVLSKKEKPLSRVQIYTKHIFFTTFRSDKQQGTAFY